MKFKIAPEIFLAIPGLVVGVVAARGIGNHGSHPAIDAFLAESAAKAEAMFRGTKVKESPDIVPYREAFRSLGINPNKYPCSIEALFSRIAKGKGMPSINPVVDLNNAVSLSFTLPMGTHDLGAGTGDIELRPAAEGDTFVPFGGEGLDNPEPGEPVYAVGRQVRTRRWAWRQGEVAKITEESSMVFFPIDGFEGFNREAVERARDTLEAWLRREFGAETVSGTVDRDHPEMKLF